MAQKICKIALILAGLYLSTSFVSNTFDGDFGWHLRFGRDAIQGNFQYLDSYTWPHYGQPWTNHEWGGDILFWLLHSAFGYFSLVILIAAAIWGTFLMINKIFSGKLTIGGLIISLLALTSLEFLLSMRLAFLVLILFALLWLTLEKLPNKKTYYLWPPILWLWSALHGSWALGFIMINIYIFGNAIFLLLKRKFPKYSGKETGWAANTIISALFWQVLSAILLIANPYGLKIWTEVGEYFTSGFFKTVITEWVPSYAYPVYIWPLVIAAFSAVFIVWGYYTKKITLAQLLLFFAIFYSAWQYKRNNAYLVLVSLPILIAACAEAQQKISSVFKDLAAKQKYISIWATIIMVCLIFIIAAPVRINKDIWQDEYLLNQYPFPYDAVRFLNEEVAGKQIYLFNEFRWGGYLNWTMQETALLYFDGRGTATWKHNENETRLERYRKIKYDAGGLKELENSRAEYVLLGQYYASYRKPNLSNRIIFGESGIKEAQPADPSQLEKMLRKSGNWQLIYEDKIALIWKKVK